jgi:hypothetical protein
MAQDNGVEIKGSGRADKPQGLSKSSQVGYSQEYTKNKPQVGDGLLWIPHCI